MVFHLIMALLKAITISMCANVYYVHARFVLGFILGQTIFLNFS